MTEFKDLNSNQQRIYSSVRSKGFGVSPSAIVINDFESVWEKQGAFGPTDPTTTPEPTTTSTTTPEPVTTTSTTTTPEPTTTTTTETTPSGP